MKDLVFKIIVKQTAEGTFMAVAPTLEDCYAEAATESEAIEQIQEQIGDAVREMVISKQPIVDDTKAAVYNLTIEFDSKPSA
jgi:predicted RNase H-like HicB family nuclease